MSAVSILSCFTDLDPSTAPMSPGRALPTILRDSAREKEDMHSAAAAAPGTLSQASSSPISTPFARRRQSLDTDPIPCSMSAQSDLASDLASVAAVAGLTSRTRDTIMMRSCSGRSIRPSEAGIRCASSSSSLFCAPAPASACGMAMFTAVGVRETNMAKYALPAIADLINQAHTVACCCRSSVSRQGQV